MMKTNYIACGNNTELIKTIPDNSIDLVVTSPPYDDLRTYNGYTFDFEEIARELKRVLKNGGVIVWIVADATKNGSETGTSFRQALFFQDQGLNIHDTMIWEKESFTAVGSLQTRYASVFEYMFVFSKGKPKTFNPIKDRVNKKYGTTITGTLRKKDGSVRDKSTLGKKIQQYGQRYNVWKIDTVKVNNYGHPAVFPVQLAKDHIISWSNEGDVVLDPFMGSGTTGVACVETNRKYIGFDISEDYCKMAERRIAKRKQDLALFLMSQGSERG